MNAARRDPLALAVMAIAIAATLAAVVETVNLASLRRQVADARARCTCCEVTP